VSEIDSYLRGDCSASPQTQALIWKSLPPVPVGGDLAPRPRNAHEVAQAADAIIKSYTDQVKKDDLSRQILGTVIGIVKRLDKAGTENARGSAGQKLVLSAAVGVTEWMLDESMKSLNKKADADEQAILGHGLDAAQRNGVKLEDLKNLDLADAYHRVFTGNAEFQIALDKVKPEHREYVIGRMTKALHDAVVAGNTAQLKLGELSLQKMEETQQSLAGLTHQVVDFSTRTKKQFSAIQQTQKSMQADLASLKETTADTDRKVSSIQGYMFKGMGISDKIAALQQGWLDLTPKQRDDALKNLESAQKKELAAQQFETYFGETKEVLQLAGQLGMKSDLLDAANKVVPMVDTLVHKIGPALASGNVIQLASAVASLFGGGGVDPETARHQEVIGALKNIQGKLDQMAGQLNTIINYQVETLKGLQTVSGQITALAAELKKVEEEVIGRLDQLSEDIGFLARLVADTGTPIKAASTFLRSRDGSKGFDGQRFTDYESLRAHFDFHGHEAYRLAWNALIGLVTVDEHDGINAIFHQQTQEGKAKGAGEVPDRAVAPRKRWYAPAFQLMELCLAGKSADEREQAWLRFLVPVEDCDEVDRLANIKPETGRTIAPMALHMRQMLAPPTVVQLLDWLIQLYFPYEEVMGPSGTQLLPLPELLKRGTERRGNPEYLKTAHVIASVAVAQQNLIAGHTLLPAIYELYESNPSVAAEVTRRNQAVAGFEKLLAVNSILRRNWVVYRLHRRMESDPTWLPRFALAWDVTAQPWLISDLVPKDWRERLSTETGKPDDSARWRVSFGNGEETAAEPLPSPPEVDAGRLKFAAASTSLIDVNDRLLDSIATATMTVHDHHRPFLSRFAARLS
jgi:hypothetical protein